MANELTAGQPALFAGPVFDRTKIKLTGELLGPSPATEIDISDRVNSYGRCRVEAYNLSPAARGKLSYPRMSWTVVNADGYFTEGHANEIWDGDRPQAFRMIYTAEDIIDPSSPVGLLRFDFNVLEVETVSDDTAIIVGIHRLSRFWAHLFTREERHTADWITNTINNEITL